MRNTLLKFAREYESGEGKGGCALLRYLRCRNTERASRAYNQESGEERRGGYSTTLSAVQEYGAAL